MISPDPAPSEASLARIARRHGLRAIVLFGSRAHGTARPGSDMDLCVVGGRPGPRDFDLIAELSTALGQNVDLVRFERAGPLLRFHAGFGGRLLWGDEQLFRRLRLRALKERQDSRKLSEAVNASLKRNA